MKYPLIPKETSWLSFNARVLQEAAEPTVPLVERLRFLGIVSSNLDEFFRVRVANLQKLAQFARKSGKVVGRQPKKVLKEVLELARSQHEQFEAVYRDLLSELERHNIFIIDEKQLSLEQGAFVKHFFNEEVRPKLCPIILDEDQGGLDLRDQFIYLAVIMRSGKAPRKQTHALIEVPTDVLPRLITLPQTGQNRYLILLDDIIRFGLTDVFAPFEFDEIAAYTIKLTRDAELDIDEDLTQSYIKKLSRSLRQRKEGNPVRFIYESEMPRSFLEKLIKRLSLSNDVDTLMPGGRYHNFRDLMKFPDFGIKQLRYEQLPCLPQRDLAGNRSLLQVIKRQDVLLHHPYQSFNYIIDLLREAAIDPQVKSIKITIYRAARTSSIMNALISAAKNGKSVVAVVELQARFDEEANINWANRLQDEGVKVIFGVPGLKVHCKLCLISRHERGKRVHYALIGTGNFNEDTAKVYSDHGLLTSHPGITKEVHRLFEFFESNYKISEFRHLIVSPFNMRSRILKLIRKEAEHARKGHEARIFLKLNNLVDAEVINGLYEASQAGVEVRLIVRSMFSLQTGVPHVSDNIRAISIIDKYLEHSRIFAFRNQGEPLYFISSADLMSRNIDQRVEVTCPIYDDAIKEELRKFLELQWRDNVKARILDQDLSNHFRPVEGGEAVRAQWIIRDFLAGKVPGIIASSVTTVSTPA